MSYVLIAILLYVLGGVVALAMKGRGTRYVLGVLPIVATGFGLVPVFRCLIFGEKLFLTLPWSLPIGQFAVGLDGLSAFFLAVLLIFSPPIMIYGDGYLEKGKGRFATGAHFFFLAMTAASMMMVLIACDSVLFLLSWELMAAFSFLMMSYEQEKEHVRSAAWLYLVVGKVGAAALLGLFFIFAAVVGDTGLRIRLYPGGELLAGVVFILALIGFGAKAGLMPAHIWLPEAHPAAPSHGSAMMSGLTLNMGIYGVARVLSLFETVPMWWGVFLTLLGSVTAVYGILCGLTRENLKRSLAYSSMENMGIVVIGLGVGTLGRAADLPVLTFCGFAGAFFHTLNHTAFKSLLFLAAGSCLRAAGVDDINRLGGLFKRMPVTGACFFAGSVSICGAPPFNGFVGEFLIYAGAFYGLTANVHPVTATLIPAIIALALSGGIALAAFTKLYGTAFSGEPRSAAVTRAREVGPVMLGPMVFLAGACVLIPYLAPLIVLFLNSAVNVVAGVDLATAGVRWSGVLAKVSAFCGVLTGLFLALWLIRRVLPRGDQKREAGTWDCGYAVPCPRAKYTGASFSAPFMEFFKGILHPKTALTPPRGLFPKKASLTLQPEEFFKDRLFAFCRRVFMETVEKTHRFQRGNLHVYALYIVITLMALLLWRLWWSGRGG